MTDTTLQVTPASQWKRRTEIKQLPSGVVAELQRPSTVDTILTNGNLPEGLAQVMLDAFVTQGNAEWKVKPEDLPAIADLVNTLCRATFVNPRIAPEGSEPNYDAGEIALNDVQDIDRMFILSWATNAGGQAPAATRFPAQQMAGVSPRPNGKALRRKTR